MGLNSNKRIVCFIFVLLFVFFGFCTSVYALNGLGKPSVKISYVDYNKVKLSWGRVKNARGYEVYKYSSKSKKYVYIARVNYTGIITSKNVECGFRSYYKVRAYKIVKGKKVYGSFSNKVSVIPKLKVPSITNVNKYSNNSVKISWNRVSGANYYLVYKYNSNNKYEYIGSAKSNQLISSYKLSDNNYTYYKVRAYRNVNGKRIYSGYSKGYKFVVSNYFDMSNLKPSINLKGDSSLVIKLGSSYIEPGYSAFDNRGNNITNRVLVSNNVNTKKQGIYYVTYSVSDMYGNINKVTRKVEVILSEKDLCKFDGPYSDKALTSGKVDYAYDGDLVYYKLTCASSNGIKSGQISSKSIKSSNVNRLKVNNIIKEQKYVSDDDKLSGYSYVIEAMVNDKESIVSNEYLTLDGSEISDNDNNRNIKSVSSKIMLGLLRLSKLNNAKPILSCNSITREQELQMENVLKDRINKVGVGTRQAVVEAARFLTLNFPYAIPYYWTDGIKDYPDSGHYPKEGLYLNEKRGWGCNIQKVKNEMGIFKIGEQYPNGLECSGYVIWALTNGGFISTGQWYSEIFKDKSDGGMLYQNTYAPGSHSLGYNNIFDYYMSDGELSKKASDTWKKLSVSSKKCIRESCGLSNSSLIDSYDIKAGDFIWKDGHIGMIIGVKKNTGSNNYCVGEATYTMNTSGGYSHRGLRTICYTTNELYNSSTGWTHIIKMDDIYGKGNLTNYKPYW